MGTTTDQIVTLNDAVAAVLRGERGVKKWTIKTMADRSGIPERTLIRLLAGERDISANQLVRVAVAFGRSATDLMGAAEQRWADSPDRELGVQDDDLQELEDLADTAAKTAARGKRKARN